MRQDLDRLMRERGLAGLVVLALDRYSPAMYYVTGQRIHYGVYFRTPDGNAYLVHDPMERDQAQAAGCPHAAFEQHGMSRIQDEEVVPARIFGRLIGEIAGTLAMRGKIAWFGEVPVGLAHTLLARAREVNPALGVDDGHPDILSLARMTKGESEVEAIRHAARGAVTAIERLRDYLAGLKRDGDTFRANGTTPVRIGDLRRLLHGVFLEHGLEGGETIVSQGRDAGVPHNRGNDAEPVRAGTPILVDIFPGEAGGGYFSDLTRTFCLGRAPEPLKRLYGDVHDAFRVGMGSLRVGHPCRASQEAVCDLFEARGHVTVRSRQGTEEGYVHGLGHGVGLAVHEPPRLGGPPSNTQALEPGMVVTVEPGLYYPSKGLGARIEDLVLVKSDGTLENLTPAPYDLEIEPGA